MSFALSAAPSPPTAPAGCVIAPYPQQGSDGVWLWRLIKAAKRRVKHEGFPTRYLTVDLGDLSWYQGRWVGHAQNSLDCSGELATAEEALAWLTDRLSTTKEAS